LVSPGDFRMEFLSGQVHLGCTGMSTEATRWEVTHVCHSSSSSFETFLSSLWLFPPLPAIMAICPGQQPCTGPVLLASHEFQDVILQPFSLCHSLAPESRLRLPWTYLLIVHPLLGRKLFKSREWCWQR
jgi:hypothetical protein